MIIDSNLSIENAYREWQSINNQISFFETQRAIKQAPKTVNFKEVIISGGRMNNNFILDSILKSDEYSEKLQQLYLSRTSYEKYILEEIRIYKTVKQGLIINFLRHIEMYNNKTQRYDKRLTWGEISKVMNYEERQCRRYYSEFKGKTPSDNAG